MLSLDVRVCRETERNEFSEAKDRLKHSWAADRDDFARVKDALKKKNADHHVQNGRLSQALKVWLKTEHCCMVCVPHVACFTPFALPRMSPQCFPVTVAAN